MRTHEPNRAARAQEAAPAPPQEPPADLAGSQPAAPRPRSLTQRAAEAIDTPGAIEYASWLQLLRHLGA